MKRAVTLLLLLAACAKEPPIDPVKLERPDVTLMIPPAPLRPIPDKEGDPKVRLPYYVQSRARCASDNVRFRDLQLYVNTITK